MVAPLRTDLDDIVGIEEHLPWTVTDLSIKPFAGMWSFNPSIHHDGETWRMVMRCADYAMPDGVAIRGPKAHPSRVTSRNAMLILDPKDWRTVKVHPMREADEWPRVLGCTNVGFEDMRLFQTADGGLQGIAASLHLDRGVLSRASRRQQMSAGARLSTPVRRAAGGRNRVVDHAQPAPAMRAARALAKNKADVSSHPPEQVLLSFDDNYHIVDAQPIRGAWSGTPQKNWSPFDRAAMPMFLYSVDRGVIYNVNGPVRPTVDAASGNGKCVDPRPNVGNIGGTEVKMTRRVVPLSAGRTTPQGYDGIRGGSQLIHIGDALVASVGDVLGGAWLSIGHEMRFIGGRKWYWHTFYVVGSSGQMLAKSPPMKLCEQGIEFAAGLVVDGNRVVVSFGIDDMRCALGETELDALLAIMEPVVPPEVAVRPLLPKSRSLE